METISIIFNNRELASLILLSVAILWGLSQRNLRVGLVAVMRRITTPVILVPLICMAGWVALEVWVGTKLTLWQSELAKPTILWASVSGLMLFFSFQKATEESGFFRRTVKATIGASVFVGFYLNLFVLSLLGELLLQVVLTVLILTSMVAGLDEVNRPVKKLLDSLLAVVGFALVIFTSRQVYLNWDAIDGHMLMLEFALPIWLTIGILPFIYLLSLYASYDSAFRGISWATNDRRARWRARIALVTSLRLRLRDAHAFTWNWSKRLAAARTFAAAREIISEFLESRRTAEFEAIEEKDKLRRYTGSDRTDDKGRRLDRREFKETMLALRWIHTCHMGWYRRKARYRDDLFDVLGDDFTRHGLPEDSGIRMEVADDGQSWYAWRRTITGWCFAIGANESPPNLWEYDGPDPPAGFPGEVHCWGEQAFSDEVNVNWTY